MSYLIETATQDGPLVLTLNNLSIPRYEPIYLFPAKRLKVGHTKPASICELDRQHTVYVRILAYIAVPALDYFYAAVRFLCHSVLWDPGNASAYIPRK